MNLTLITCKRTDYLSMLDLRNETEIFYKKYEIHRKDGNINCGSPIKNFPLEIQFFNMSAISRALTMLDSGTAGMSSPLNLI